MSTLFMSPVSRPHLQKQVVEHFRLWGAYFPFRFTSETSFVSSHLSLPSPFPWVKTFPSSQQQPSQQQFWGLFLWSQVLFLCYSIFSEAWVNWDLTPCHWCCVKWLINSELETTLAVTNRAFSNQRCSQNVCPGIEPPLNPCEFRRKWALSCPSVTEFLSLEFVNLRAT